MMVQAMVMICSKILIQLLLIESIQITIERLSIIWLFISFTLLGTMKGPSYICSWSYVCNNSMMVFLFIMSSVLLHCLCKEFYIVQLNISQDFTFKIVVAKVSIWIRMAVYDGIIYRSLISGFRSNSTLRNKLARWYLY